MGSALILFGLSLAGIVFFVIGIMRTAPLMPGLIPQLGQQRVRRLCLVLFVSPLVSLGVVTILYLTLWRSEPLIRFTHAAWLLGLWMVGTVAILVYLPSVRLGKTQQWPLLTAFLLAIPMAIYSTPLSHFEEALGANMLYPALGLGIAALILNLLIVYRIWAATTSGRA